MLLRGLGGCSGVNIAVRRRRTLAWALGRRDSLLDSPRHSDKSFLHIIRIFRRSFNVGDFHAIGKLLGNSGVDDTLVEKVGLVADEELVDVLAGVAVDLAQPLLDVVEGLHVGAVKHKDDTLGAAVVAASDGAETLLAGRIPDLKLDDLAVAVQGLDLEIDTDGADVRVRPRIVGKTEKKAGLAYARIANKKNLEEIVAIL